jgi:putative transposase
VLAEHGMTIAPQTYYRWLACPIRLAELEEAYLVNEIVDIYRRNKCVYGVRKMWHAARRDVHRTVTTVRDERAPRHPDLVKRGWTTPNRPDAVWCADFTYVWTAAGFCYVSFITDVYSRRILGWRAALSKTTDLVTAALAQALSTRRRADAEFTARGLIHHSDAGSQYTALAFTEELVAAGIAGSIGTVGDALDNALMESTIGLYKTECITATGRRNRGGLRDVERETAEWVRWYNHDRIHSSIDYLTPVERELMYAATIAQRGEVA